MSILEKIYDYSPIFFQNIMVSFAGLKKNKVRYGNTYYQYREFLKEFDKWSLEKKLDYQKKELFSFLKYAYTNSSFYRELYKSIDLHSLSGIDDLTKFPILEKETLRANINEVITINKGKAVEGHTGGTTGKSLVVYNTIEDSMKRMAVLDHFKSRVGFEHLKMRRATFNGKHIIPPNQKRNVYWRYNKACKQMIYSSFHLSEENMKFYVESLNSFKPHALDGFFTCIVDIASYIERHNIQLNFQPVAVFPTSETLTENGRKMIERVFNCKVYDQYASSEGAPFVTECKNQKLHIELSTGVFERMSDESDEILVTSFTTHGTPLIRYRIGDSMLFDDSDNKCSCGVNSPMIKHIEGRSLDYLVTTSGARINGGNIANLFKNMPNALVRAQVIQERIGEVMILLEVDNDLYKTEYDDLLKNEFMHKFGKDTRIDILHVSQIERESNGKYRLIKNNIT